MCNIIHDTYTYFLILATSSPNGFSQQYIFITLIPEMISFMTFTLSSVWIAVLFLSMNVKSRCSVSSMLQLKLLTHVT